MLKQFHEKVSNNFGHGIVIMRKILGMLVLGLLWCSAGYTEEITLKCTIKKIEIEYKEDDTANMVGETSFMKLDTEDKTLFKTELVYANFYIWDNLRNNTKLKKAMTLETINRYDGL